ncbi:hypothetical protein CPB83DRAFT_846517 [Crepidotus variabilis]|uniref:Oxidoreductase AflY n=1 Tax=Crepidotus variabilis TaxID=179855 RepID=A0A9P6EN45_9AGAR|nr:hypothetical protein CPB83DRAFT_846517 [Crepidotus variabilis]
MRSFTMTRPISYQLTKQGQVNFPGLTASSKKLTEALVKKDSDEHHCYYRPSGIHNHTIHHILAAYDLGAKPALLQKIFNQDAPVQRPIILEEQDKGIVVDGSNWKRHVGTTHHDYNALYNFFSKQIAEHGISETLSSYVFDQNANKGGTLMLLRVFSGLLHPLIQIGYGLEFGHEAIIATGLAQAATGTFIQGSIPTFDTTAPEKTISLLELLRRVSESDILKPPPFNPDTLISKRFELAYANGGIEELQRLCSLYHISDTITDDELDKKIDEIFWVATLLLSATGKKGRKPRLDFFFMHFVTSSILIRPWFGYLKKQEHKAAFFRIYVFTMMALTLARGRPKIDISLAMSYPAVVRQPMQSNEHIKPSEDALGSPFNDDDFNPWPELIQGALYHPECHVVKTIRSLAYYAKNLGTTSPGDIPGAWRDADSQVETFPGVGQLDGTIFVRAAGLVLNTLGWCAHGQKQGKWDYSALGWDEAWDNED